MELNLSQPKRDNFILKYHRTHLQFSKCYLHPQEQKKDVTELNKRERRPTYVFPQYTTRQSKKRIFDKTKGRNREA